MKGLLALRRLACARGQALTFAEDMFRLYWEFLCPALILLIADTAGCYADPPEGEIAQCGNRATADEVMQMQLCAGVLLGRVLTSQDWGLALTEASCLLLELSAVEKATMALAAASFILTLKVAALRDVEGEATFATIMQGHAVVVLLVAAGTLLALNFESIIKHRSRRERSRSRESTAQTRVRSSMVNQVRSTITVHHVRVLPRFWAFLLMGVTCVFLGPGVWHAASVRGTVLVRTCDGSLSLFALTTHSFMFLGDARSAWPQHVHWGAQVTALCFGVAAHGSSPVSIATTLVVWVGFARGRTRLAHLNPRLVTELSTRSFRWLMRAGLATALFLYFETLGCVLNPSRFSFEGRMCDRSRSSCEFGQDSCVALEHANGAMLVNSCISAAYSFILLDDVRCTFKQIMRGLAPAHVTISFPLILLSVLLAVFMFAGREFAGASEAQLFDIADTFLSGLWILLGIVCVGGHFRWRAQRAVGISRNPTDAPAQSMDEALQLGELGML